MEILVVFGFKIAVLVGLCYLTWGPGWYRRFLGGGRPDA